MSRQAPVESTNQQRTERRLVGRRLLLLGSLALAFTGCDLFSTANNPPTPAPIVFNTPTSYTFPTDTPTPPQTAEPTASVTDTPMPDSTPGSTETPTGTPAAAPTETPGTTETPTVAPTETPTATYVPTPAPSETPSPGQSTGRPEVEATGTYTYTSYYDANSRALYLGAGETAVAECVLFVQNSSDAGEIDAWYRLDSPSGYHGETLYAAADTFTNPGSPPPGAYDNNLAVCPDSPLPPQS